MVAASAGVKLSGAQPPEITNPISWGFSPARCKAIRAAAAQNYEQFYKQELRFREIMHYPPFAAIANVLVKSASAETALRLTGRLGGYLETHHGTGLRILGPAAAPISRLKKSYRYHFLIKAVRRSLLRKTLLGCREFAAKEKFPAAALIIDVDPQSLL